MERENRMDDLISRQRTLKALKDNVIEMGGDDFTEKGVHENDIDAIINKLPSAQPEIIRCKDCRYAKMTHTGECKYCTYLADNFGIDDAVYFEGNDYCSHAERITDE